MATEKKKKSALQDLAGTAATAIILMILLTIFVFPLFYGDKPSKSLEPEIEAIAKAMETYRSEKGMLPKGTQSEISAALLAAGLEHESVDKTGRLLDPWGMPYQIHSSNDGFVIRSAGRNAKFDAGGGKASDDIFHGSH